MSNDRIDGHEERLRAYRLRILRVGPGEKMCVRMLSKSIKGMFNHFKDRRSHYCPGRQCNCQHSRLPRLWKGYVASERYDQEHNLWLPHVLEVTEYLELDMRGIYQRGQVWQLSRLKEEGKQKKPVTGLLLEVRDEKTFPPPHQILETLRHLYHALDLELLFDNPLPGRTMVQPSQAEPPEIVKKELPPDPADRAEATAKIREFAERLREPRNGQAKQ